MDKDTLDEILKHLFDVVNLTYTLKVALSNEEQPTGDILPYSTVAKLIEREIYSATGLISDMAED